MPRTPSLVAKEDPRSPGRWIVSTPGSMSPDGKLHRSYYRDKGDADAAAAKLRSAYHRGIRNASIDPLLARQASEAIDLLKPFNVSLLDVVRSYVERAKRTGTKTFRQQYDAFVATNEDRWSPTYRRAIEALERRLPKWFFQLPLAEIAPDVVEKAVRERAEAQSTVETWTRHVNAVLGGKSRKKRDKLPVILTDEQVAGMLEACENEKETHAVALLLFAGIRPDSEGGEITKLLWEDVGARQIDLRAEVSKTGSERLIPIKPRLRKLIKGHSKTGPVIPANWKRRYARIRKAAGLTKAHHDATRHTFASHFLAAYGETATQAAMGHVEGSRTLFRHYRRAVTQTAGRKYFA